jgi:hypothetical protein
MPSKLTSYDRQGRNLCYLNEKQLDFLVMKDKLMEVKEPSFYVVEETHVNGPKLELLKPSIGGFVYEYVLVYATPMAQHRLATRFRHCRRGAKHSRQWSANGMAIPFYPM